MARAVQRRRRPIFVVVFALVVFVCRVISSSISALCIAHADPVQARLEQPGQALAAKEKHAPARVGGVARLEEEQVVQLAHALVYAPAEAAEGDDVEREGVAAAAARVLLVVVPDVGHRLGEVGAFLLGDVQDLRC